MAKIIPNGSSIAEARKIKGLKQEDFARTVGMSVRKFRDVETRSLPIPQWQLREISNKLGAGAEEFVAPTSIGQAPPPDDTEVQLRPVNGTELIEMAKQSAGFEYHVMVTFKSDELAAMLPILRVVRTYTQWLSSDGKRVFTPEDEFDNNDFGDLHRIACVNDAMEKLKAANIVVLANTFAVQDFDDFDFRTCLAFVESKTRTLNVTVKFPF